MRGFEAYQQFLALYNQEAGCNNLKIGPAEAYMQWGATILVSQHKE